MWQNLQTFPSVFAYCNQSHAGGGNILETSLASLQVEAKLSVIIENKDLAFWPQIYSLSLTLHWKQLAEIRVGTKIGRAFEYQKAKVNFLGQGYSMPFIFQVGLRALHQPTLIPTLASYSHSNTSTAPTLLKLSPSDQPKIPPYRLWACARAHPRSPWGPANFPSLDRYACLVKFNCVCMWGGWCWESHGTCASVWNYHSTWSMASFF